MWIVASDGDGGLRTVDGSGRRVVRNAPSGRTRARRTTPAATRRWRGGCCANWRRSATRPRTSACTLATALNGCGGCTVIGSRTRCGSWTSSTPPSTCGRRRAPATAATSPRRGRRSCADCSASTTSAAVSAQRRYQARVDDSAILSQKRCAQYPGCCDENSVCRVSVEGIG